MPLILQVRQHKFEISREYAEGHVCTSAEAAALNQAMMENIRDNVYSWVNKSVDEYGVLTAERHEALQARINSYAEKYTFKTRKGYKPITPMESTIREVAAQDAERWGQQHGLNLNSTEVRLKYHELCRDPSIADRARDLIRSRQSTVDSALEGLI